MTDIYTMGTWTPAEGKTDAFSEAWAEFAGWASAMPGAGTLRLARDARNPRRFVSFGVWQNVESVRAWKSSPEFRERIARVLQHVDEFEPTELGVVATAESGAAEVLAEPAAVEPVHAP